MKQFDWHGMLSISMTRLGLSVDQFWKLTPREFAILTGVNSLQKKMTRNDLIALEQSFASLKQKGS